MPSTVINLLVILGTVVFNVVLDGNNNTLINYHDDKYSMEVTHTWSSAPLPTDVSGLCRVAASVTV